MPCSLLQAPAHLPFRWSRRPIPTRHPAFSAPSMKDSRRPALLVRPRLRIILGRPTTSFASSVTTPVIRRRKDATTTPPSTTPPLKNRSLLFAAGNAVREGESDVAAFRRGLADGTSLDEFVSLEPLAFEVVNLEPVDRARLLEASRAGVERSSRTSPTSARTRPRSPGEK